MTVDYTWWEENGTGFEDEPGTTTVEWAVVFDVIFDGEKTDEIIQLCETEQEAHIALRNADSNPRRARRILMRTVVTTPWRRSLPTLTPEGDTDTHD
jgi:hypothetical protein